MAVGGAAALPHVVAVKQLKPQVRYHHVAVLAAASDTRPGYRWIVRWVDGWREKEIQQRGIQQGVNCEQVYGSFLFSWPAGADFLV